MSGNPRAQTPQTDTKLAPHPSPQRSLVEELGGTVDDLRQLYTDFGLRPYRVFSVVVRWDGGAIGRGTERVVRETELLPTPNLVDTRGLRKESRQGGTVERGSIQLRQVSPRLTEEEILTIFHRRPLEAGEQGFLEARIDARDGQTERRRFIVRGVPFRHAKGFEWRVDLSAQEERRERSGAPSAPVMHRL